VNEKPRGHFETALKILHMPPADRFLLNDFIEASGVAGESDASSAPDSEGDAGRQS